MIAMGLEKIPQINGCDAWENMTYLKWFYEREQPMPTAFAWHAYHLPMIIHKISAVATWFIEIIVPLICFAPNPLYRRMASILLMLFQLPIMITGNYSILNWLTIVLCIPALDDAVLSRTTVADTTDLKEEGQSTRNTRRRGKQCGMKTLMQRVCGPVVSIYLLFHMAIGAMYTLRIVEPSGISYLANPNWIFDRRYKHSWANRMKIMPRSMLLWLQRYHVIQQYGGVFFGTFDHDGKMVAIIEGSNDGRNWYEYAYKYHVQDTREPPQFFAPLFPRLDHMIFYETNQISFNKINPLSPLFAQNPPGFVFLQLIQRLLENEPAVTQLFRGQNLQQKPRYIRVTVFNYKFTNHNTTTDEYWKRSRVLELLPPVSIGTKDGLHTDNFYSLCYFTLLCHGMPLETIKSGCSGKVGNIGQIASVYDFQDPLSILKKSRLMFLFAMIGLPESYTESIREILSWNKDENKTMEYTIFHTMIKLKDRCEAHIATSISQGSSDGKSLMKKLYSKGLTPRETQKALTKTGYSTEDAYSAADKLFTAADEPPTFDRLLTMEEIMACTECYYALCREQFQKEIASLQFSKYI